MPTKAVKARETFATRFHSGVLAVVRDLAENASRQRRDLKGAAFAGFLEKLQGSNPRAQVIAADAASHTEYAAVYKSLAGRTPTK